MIDVYAFLKQEFVGKKVYDPSSERSAWAQLIAHRQHMSQARKYTGDEYAAHCQEVVTILCYADRVTEEAAQAAWLHDTVEDTAYTLKDVEREFGDTVARYVWYLTSCPKFVGDRAKRAAIDRDRLVRAPRLVKEIKCADIISNCLNIAELDPVFARNYLREKEELLFYLDKMQWEFKNPDKDGIIKLLPLATKVVKDGLAYLETGGAK
jgi:(p)ppGpp synthase/HD superfamily hydrolase